MSNEAEFIEVLKRRVGIRRGVPNTIIGFDGNGKPELSLKSSIGGNTQLLESLDYQGGSSNSVLWSFSQAYPFQYNSGVFQSFKVVINMVCSGQGDFGYRPNDIPDIVNYNNDLQQAGLSFGTGIVDRISLGNCSSDGITSFEFMKTPAISGQPFGTGFFHSALLYTYINNQGFSGGGHFKDNVPNGNNSIGDSISSIRFLTGGGETIENGFTARLYGLVA